MMLTSDLEDQEHEAISVIDGPAAAVAFDAGHFDVAIIDLGLPGLPGDELARQLRQVDPVLVTVLISGWNLGEGDSRLEAFDFYLHKPFGPKEIQRVINRATDLRTTRTKAP